MVCPSLIFVLIAHNTNVLSYLYRCLAFIEMRSSLGSDAFAVLALAFISLFVLLLLRHFLPLRTTPAYLILPIFLSLALPISIILLVPIDLASSSRPDEEALRGIWLPEGVRLVAWRLTYWLTFALTWYRSRESYRLRNRC